MKICEPCSYRIVRDGNASEAGAVATGQRFNLKTEPFAKLHLEYFAGRYRSRF